MDSFAIRVEGLGKKYRIKASREKYKTFRDTLVNVPGASLRATKNLIRSNLHQDIEGESIHWALRDVSFEILPGDVAGIIGRNGAGKSTLLKILSRITEPSEGYADIAGRVISLLEVGTGFHPELSGRENILLNGTILGMKQTEIKRKFDEIVSFAEVEKFVDTPVKHYSSGMYLRLAFSVAAHLEPEILIVDEVLAVGDAAFQRKCLGKMGQVAQEGRTVLFVSHSMEAILSLCSRGLVLSGGRLVFSGSSEESVQFYNRSSSKGKDSKTAHILYDRPPCELQTSAKIIRLEILDSSRRPKPNIYTWDDVVFRMHYVSDQDYIQGSTILEIRDYKNQRLCVFDSGLNIPILRGEHYIDCCISKLPLSAGDFYVGVGLAISRHEWIWRDENVASLNVNSKDVFDIGRPPVTSRMLIAVPHSWQTER